MTLPERIMRSAATHDRVQVVFAASTGHRETTLGALVTDALRVATALRAEGIGPGDVVAVQLGSTYEGAVTQAAVTLTGAVLLPIVLIYGHGELGFILRQSGAVALVLAGCVRGRAHAASVLAGLTPRPPALRTVVVAGDYAPAETVPFRELLRSRTGARDAGPVPCAPDARALLVYTSGTTAQPKGVQHSHRSLLAEVDGPGFGPRQARRQLAVFPAGHVAGLLGLLRVLVQGTPTVVLEAWDAARAAALVDTHQLTHGVGAPTQLAGLLDERDRGTASLASIEDFMTGAAGVPPALIERADAAGIPAYRAYGSSEHPTISSGVPADPLRTRAHTDGRVLPGSEVRLIDEVGVDVAPGTPGEIVSRGAELFLGYSDSALDGAAFLPDRWFRTGDIGTLDADGYLTITDRRKDIIIRGGENISAKEIEDVLVAHAAVREVAAVGLPDAQMGERVCAVVVLAPGRTLDLEEVREHVAAAGLARQKTPERIVVVDELPRNPVGKVQKFLLRERLAQRA